MESAVLTGAPGLAVKLLVCLEMAVALSRRALFPYALLKIPVGEGWQETPIGVPAL